MGPAPDAVTAMTHPLQLQAGPYSPDQLFVTSVDGMEALSTPFEVGVDFFPRDNEPLDLAGLLDADGLLTIASPTGEPRHFHGTLLGVQALGEQGGRLRYRIQLGPTLARLARVERCRIFQEKTTEEIVHAVLAEGGVTHRFALQGAYGKREMCVQYRETDLAFVSRLLEHEGIFYFFEHTDSAHELVFSDDRTAHAALPGGEQVPFRYHDGRIPDEEHLFSLEEIHRLRSDATAVRDYDFKKPELELSGEASGDGGTPEVYEYPGEVADLSGAKAAAKARLQERRMGARTLDGQSHCPRLCPGYLLEVVEHPQGAWNGKYVLVAVRHRARAREVLGEPEAFHSLYRNAARLLPEDVPYRPPLRAQRPVIPGIQTAVVVGASGEEIHTDAHARVKVKFHWDRASARDDTASCWVRVSQAWGGAAYGAVFLPRMGQEVVVRFLEGNPDRPLVCGAVYNGEKPPPASLSDEKTQSTVHSSSSPGDGGNNELRFEDAAGAESIDLHAQKDDVIAVERDKGQEVWANEALLVKKDRRRRVDGNQRLEVSLQDAADVVGNQQLTVTGGRTTTVALGQGETVEQVQSITVGGSLLASAALSSSETVGAAKALTVGGALLFQAAEGISVAVGGVKGEQVAGVRSERVEGSRDETVEKDRKLKVAGEDVVQTDKSLKITVGKDITEEVGKKAELGTPDKMSLSAKKMELKADKLNVVVGGKLLLTIEKSGKVKLFGKTLTLESD